MHAENVWFGALRVYNLGFPGRRTECLLVRTVEEVVGRVPLELSLTHSAGGSWGSSTLGVQTLDEGDICQEFATRWPLLISDGLQQEAGNRASIRATCRVVAGIDRSNRFCPHLAGIERTLPGRVATLGYRDGRIIGVGIDAGEVGDDLNVLAEDLRKEGGFRTGGIDRPGSAAGARVGQANVPLTTLGMAHQKCSVPRRCRNAGRSRRNCDVLRQQLLLCRRHIRLQARPRTIAEPAQTSLFGDQDCSS